MQRVGEVAIADSTNLDDDPSGLSNWLHGSALRSSCGIDLFVVCHVQIFDSLKPFLCPYPIFGPEHLPLEEVDRYSLVTL